jgi:hypothetical protein
VINVIKYLNQVTIDSGVSFFRRKIMRNFRNEKT